MRRLGIALVLVLVTAATAAAADPKAGATYRGKAYTTNDEFIPIRLDVDDEARKLSLHVRCGGEFKTLLEKVPINPDGTFSKRARHRGRGPIVSLVGRFTSTKRATGSILTKRCRLDPDFADLFSAKR